MNLVLKNLEKIKLISIVLNDTSSTEFTEKQIRHTTKRVRGMISVTVQEEIADIINPDLQVQINIFIPDLIDTL